ncbi:rod shape-determining protein MreC [Colwellia chukchiensis]|uniref:Cell shape-determining protein MreC n=1 Tax=Colwellia chukchiensis TaxID=641665 RepID=A0A1H7L9W9_9GAMM|nr:rod shape-determining protein MreC [Colwellia chukchiensis]SEK95556.1 rod shape-determining protein MreC [Colwellia chukchiensis]
MNPIFKHGPSPQHRLILVLFCSALLIFFDHKMNSFESARGFLQSMVSPLQYLATAPKQLMNWAAENMVTRRQLIADNEQYKINELTFHEQALQLAIIKRENDRLRALLASPLRADAKKMVAEILAVDSDPYTHQVVINRGANDGVYEGQAVIDDEGIVGQILHVGTTSSRVLLITDVTHAVPVRISRNGVRLIASGVGVIDTLTHNHVPHSTDIRVGDTLVSSGLGGKFPEGYPVAKVSVVRQDESRAFSQIQSQPVAKIDRLRYVLLLWPEQERAPATAKLDNKAVNE